MYNEELENLIDAALADGILTEKEKQVLFKKAQAMGIDLDEFEMVLDARLVKLKKAEQEKAASSAPKSNKLGDVKKCPACGAMVQSYYGMCPECGYAFEGVEANSSAQKLAKAIEQATADGKKRYDLARQQANEIKKSKAQSGKKTSFFDLDSESVRDDTDEVVAKTISSFPVPTAKADLIEFILALEPKTRSTHGVLEQAYREKYVECVRKAKFVFPNDPQFVPLLVDYEANKADYEAREKARKRKTTLIVIFSIIGGIAFFGLWLLLDILEKRGII